MFDNILIFQLKFINSRLRRWSLKLKYLKNTERSHFPFLFQSTKCFNFHNPFLVCEHIDRNLRKYCGVFLFPSNFPNEKFHRVQVIQPPPHSTWTPLISWLSNKNFSFNFLLTLLYRFLSFSSDIYKDEKIPI